MQFRLLIFKEVMLTKKYNLVATRKRWMTP